MRALKVAACNAGANVDGGSLTRFDVLQPSDRTLIAAVDGLLCWPDGAFALLLLAHGAGAGMAHRNLEHISQGLAQLGVATLRFNFPFMQAGRKRVDDTPTAVAAIVAALQHAHTLMQTRQPLPVFAGGHSFGARMATHAAADGTLLQLRGLVLCAFPLHAAGKPSTRRAEHLVRVPVPSVYISGTRDALADLRLLRQCLQPLNNAELHELHDADHSYLARQRERVDRVPVLDELVSVAAAWMRGQIARVTPN